MPAEERSPGSRQTQEATRSRRLGNLTTPPSVQKLQSALHAKAKEEPGYRFYLLYDKVSRADVLVFAYRCCKANKGAAGVDGQTFEDIEAYGEVRWIRELAQRLRNKTYEPDAVKRVWIPKPNSSKLRPLGVPTIADRVVETAAMLVLEPIFGADLAPEQYAYRPDRGAHDAVRAVHSLLNTGHTQVIDADLSGYFDSIPHAELLQCVARRIVDRHILRLIKAWLVAPVDEDDGKGRTTRSRANRDSKRGTPQGAPISPLLSNLYMRRFVEGWRRLGCEQRWSAHIVNYADDFVICCKRGAPEAMVAMRRIMDRLKLTVNEEKTHLCEIPRERFDFLGYTFGRCYSRKDGHAYIGTRPSKKSIKRMVASISEVTDRRTGMLDAEEIVGRLNRKLTGWANYFCLGPVSPAYQQLDTHVRERLRRWLCKKHKDASTGSSRFPDQFLYEKLGLVRLAPRTHDLPWAKA
ncbi:MAG: group II intron reverse transcriptase/maturase [Burkholderiales bacterium]|nr:group II intron reverse transcriptase/maturase [Burkholderiales bacterium]